MLKKEIENRLLVSKKNIVAKLDSKDQETLKWICIYPKKDQKEAFKILILELPKEIIEEDLDWFEEDEKKEEYEIDSYEGLIMFLVEARIEMEQFDYPWNTQYPYPDS